MTREELRENLYKFNVETLRELARQAGKDFYDVRKEAGLRAEASCALQDGTLLPSVEILEALAEAVMVPPEALLRPPEDLPERLWEVEVVVIVHGEMVVRHRRADGAGSKGTRILHRKISDALDGVAGASVRLSSPRLEGTSVVEGTVLECHSCPMVSTYNYAQGHPQTYSCSFLMDSESTVQQSTECPPVGKPWTPPLQCPRAADEWPTYDQMQHMARFFGNGLRMGQPGFHHILPSVLDGGPVFLVYLEEEFEDQADQVGDSFCGIPVITRLSTIRPADGEL